MENIESKNILQGDGEDTIGKENKKQEYKLNFTIRHEQEAEKAKEKIKGLNEESKKLIDASGKLIDASEKLIDAYEEKKKGSDDLSA